MKRLFATLALVLAAAAPAQAGHSLVDVAITDLDSGEVLPLYPHRGRQYVAGTPGHRYGVTMINRTGERVLAVVSVDGVNVVSGETAGAQQSGYVLGPWEQAEISGWRKSMSEIAEFYFTDLPDSYAARTGRPQNVGVIGVAVFREARPYRYAPPAPPIAKNEPYSRDDRAAAEPSTSAQAAPAGAAQPSAKSAESMARQELGTGHGERRYAPVDTTEFERASGRPNQVLSVYYDDYMSLVDRGVIPRQHRYGREPDPFPMGFVPDP